MNILGIYFAARGIVPATDFGQPQPQVRWRSRLQPFKLRHSERFSATEEAADSWHSRPTWKVFGVEIVGLVLATVPPILRTSRRFRSDRRACGPVASGQ